MTEPTDAEILELASQYWYCLDETESATEIELVRAALAKWGAQPVVREPLTDEQIDDYIRHADVRGRYGETFARGIRWGIRHYERAHGIGIKGGQHGTE